MFATLLLAASLAGGAAPCTAGQLSLAVDDEGGGFNGMSHSGTLLVLRNDGPRACAMPRRPGLILTNGGRALAISAARGPASTAITIAAGAAVATPLRWVSGNVYEDGRCLTATAIGFSIGGKALRTPLSATLCGPATGTIRFEQPQLHPAPAPPGR